MNENTMSDYLNEMMKKRKIYTKTHAVFAIFTFFLSGFYFRYLLNGAFWGENKFLIAVFAVVFCLFGFLFFRFRSKKAGAEAVFFMILTCVYSLRNILISDSHGVISLISVLVIHLTALLFTASIQSSVIDDIIPAVFRAVIIAPFSSFFALPASFSAFFSKISKKNNDVTTRNFVLAVVGVCISLPILAIVVSLLSSDSFFSGFMGKTLDFFADLGAHINFSDYFNFMTVLIAFYIFGAFYSADCKPVVKRAEEAKIYSIVTNTVIIVLMAVYILFIISQIDGYICMISGRIPAGTSYAEFARSGFFELCVVACINGIVLYIANAFTEKDGKYTKLFSAILVCVTLMIILTSAAKMVMYISAYGFTPKRFYTMWFMLLLSLIFSMSAVKLRKEAFRISAYSVYVTAAMLIVLFFVDYEWLSDVLNRLYVF